MKVLVAGATGVIGSQLVPELLEAGHDVSALARSQRRTGAIEAAGVEPVIVDALDAQRLTAAVRVARPDAVVNLLTAIPPGIDPRRIAAQFELTNRLRTEGTHNLIAAARAAGADRIVAESVAFAYDPSGGRVKAEEAPLWHDPPRQFAPVIEALKTLERYTIDAHGTVLRFGQLYGPGSGLASDGTMAQAVRARKMPIVGDGGATLSFVHAHDAARAIVSALESDERGTFNVVDDDPRLFREWLPAYAKLLGAPEPRRVPTVLARVFAGRWGVAYATQLRGASNARARELLGWAPLRASFEEGFRELAGAGRRSL